MDSHSLLSLVGEAPVVFVLSTADNENLPGFTRKPFGKSR